MHAIYLYGNIVLYMIIKEIRNGFYSCSIIQAKIWPFDKNFFNFEDMEVLKKFLNPNETQIWKDTFGFDYAAV